ncbi:MAG: sigma-70 family RNA polymerase sigma factor [Planctomycetes bacterium]|nr:sigma-70 family RNA polymerase sigma factor [Planctomycetota bacterium]NUQ34658.1 sigma-70 family RNA polymerase sigma factor [Planctomycetaceae bacterium]
MDTDIAGHLERAKAGDPEALAYVMTAAAGFVMNTAMQFTHDRHLAEDIAQETLTVACARLNDLREPQAFHGWLAAIARSCVSRATRRMRPDFIEDVRDAAALVPDPSPLDDVGSRETVQMIRGCIAGLSEKSRAVIERHYLQGESVEQIAQTLGIPAGTVKRRLHDAREQMRFKLAGLSAQDDWMG